MPWVTTKKAQFINNFCKYNDIANKRQTDNTFAVFFNTFDNCKQWIIETNQVPSKSDPGRGDVFLESAKAKKYTALTKILFPTMNGLGIGDYVCGAEPGEHKIVKMMI